MKNFTALMALLTFLAAGSPVWSSSKLFVGGLSWSTSSDEVKRLVEAYGAVQSVRVNSTDQDGDLSAVADVEFEGDQDADRAAAALDGYIYMGEPLIARVKKPREIVVVGSKVKEVIREAGLQSDGELVQAVSDKVYELLDIAIARATANGRSTVRPYDL